MGRWGQLLNAWDKGQEKNPTNLVINGQVLAVDDINIEDDLAIVSYFTPESDVKYILKMHINNLVFIESE
jgi:hypothetical protein